jgi:phage shock protein A
MAMNGLKRIFISLAAQTTRIMDDFENHEAVAEAALREFAGLLAKVDAQARASTAELESLDRRVEQLKVDILTWSRRAVAEQAHDRTRALECVRRLQAKQRDLAETEQQRLSVSATLREIEHRRDELRTQLTQLQQRHRQLVARQSHTDAQTLAGESDYTSTCPQDVFARWETRLATAEALQTPAHAPDVFAAQFTAAEEDQALQASLDELIATAARDHRQQGE